MDNQEYEIKTLSDYQKIIEKFEKVNDQYLFPESYIVARIDARRFGPEWDKLPDEAYPFDEQLVASFIATARWLMSFGVKVTYAFIHGDEISLLLDKSESYNLRKRDKLTSLIASAGSLFFTQNSDLSVLYRSKLSELPSKEHVIDYFFWQRKVAARNYFSCTLAKLLADRGLNRKEIVEKIAGLPEADQYTLSEQLDHPIDKIPKLILRGAACWWDGTYKGQNGRILQSAESTR